MLRSYPRIEVLMKETDEQVTYTAQTNKQDSNDALKNLASFTEQEKPQVKRMIVISCKNQKQTRYSKEH